jgi:hypothetical protein
MNCLAYLEPGRCCSSGRTLAKNSVLKAKAILQTSERGLVIVRLPSHSVRLFGTKRQVRVEGQIDGVSFKTVAFPTGDGRHFVFVNQKLQSNAGVKSGDTVSILLRRRPHAKPVSVPKELIEAIDNDQKSATAWRSLSPSARLIASTWINQAKSPAVRRWRASNVLKRAVRFYEGKGPFYPTGNERSHLGMPRGRV